MLERRWGAVIFWRGTTLGAVRTRFRQWGASRCHYFIVMDVSWVLRSLAGSLRFVAILPAFRHHLLSFLVSFEFLYVLELVPRV